MLYHFSEDPTIARFDPRPHPSHPALPPAVWAIDRERAPMYFFPRDCPRIAFYRLPETTSEDADRFLGHTTARMVIATENGWYGRIRQAKLYVYHLPPEPFTCWEPGAGYYIAHESIEPLKVEPMGDLIERLTSEDVELRLMPSLWPLHDALLASSLHFSMIRMRNASR